MKTRLGHYEIVAELGRGGMGVVYKGYEPALSRYVAIKELSPALAHDATLVERFLREARSMAALNDPHIIQIYFIGQEDDQPFFVMEFVEGESLSGLLKRSGKLSQGDALKILLQSARGLSVAHDRGVIHRDIKPGNLMVSPRGQIKIADFGIALANHDISQKLTSTGEFVGTPGYLSPEVCLGKPVDARSDIFALGIVLFEMLTGRTPFSDESPLKLMLDVVQSEIPDIRAINSDVDPQTADILKKMLAKDPADRYQDTHALVADLEAHPLAQGSLSIKPAAPTGAAATMIGLPTPMTPGVAMRAPTPPPQVGATRPSGQQAMAPPAAAPAPPRESMIERPPQKTNYAPLLVGVGLILLAGVLFAMRGSLFGGDATSTEANTVAAAPAAGPDAPAGDGSASAANPDASATVSAASTAAATGGDAGMAPATGPAATTTAPSDAVAAPGDSLASAPAAVENGSLPAAPSAPEPAPAASSGPAPEGAGASSLASRDSEAGRGGRVAERREAVRERVLGAQRRYAIDAVGDPALTLPAQQLIEERFMGAGLNVVDNPRSADVVIRVRAEVIGSQDISFYGQSATLTTAYLSVRPYAFGTRALGSGFRQKIDYTPANADQKVEALLNPNLDRVLSSARDGQ